VVARRRGTSSPEATVRLLWVAWPGRLPHPSGVRRPARQRIRHAPGAGATYEEVAQTNLRAAASSRAGASCRQGHARGQEDELCPSRPAPAGLLDEGVCAIEIKSGYGLALEHERKQLRVARRLGRGVWRDGAHHLPGRTRAAARIRGRSQDYIDLVCNEMLPALAAEGLVDAVDVFCERIGFSLAETEQVFQAAQGWACPVKLHAEQLSDMGGAALAARYGALSCDHIEHLSPRHRGHAGRRHRGRAAARRLLHAARHPSAAHPGAARAGVPMAVPPTTTPAPRPP
jgi:imidazolonepropionase